MKRITTFVMFIAIFGSLTVFDSCAVLPDGNGGKLYPTPKSALDGLFLTGDVKYVKKYLKVKAWKDPAEYTTHLYVEYKNTGPEGIDLVVDCNWTLDGHTHLGVAETYKTVLFPYSKYIVRRTARRGAQKHLTYSCDHKRTNDGLYNRELMLNR